MKELAPIALFVYNRPDHTRRTVEALQANALAAESDLFIYSDAAKTVQAAARVQQVRDYVRSITGFKSITVIERPTNWGVDPSVIDGVTKLCNTYGRAIVLEDDLVTSPWFLRFMNEALLRYRDDAQVMQIAGFMFPIGLPDDGGACFLGFISSWGWATWKRAWDQFDASAAGYAALSSDERLKSAFDLDGAYPFFEMLEEFVDGKLDAWDIRWYLSVFSRQGMTLFPKKSLVTNIGFDGSGVHCPESDFAGHELTKFPVTELPAVRLDTNTALRVATYLRSQSASEQARLSFRIKRKLKKIWAAILSSRL